LEKAIQSHSVLALTEIVSPVSETFSVLAFLQAINTFSGASALETGPWIRGLPEQFQCGLGFFSPIDSEKSKSYYLVNAILFLVSFVKMFIEFF
jgi:hypothetical protein